MKEYYNSRCEKITSLQCTYSFPFSFLQSLETIKRDGFFGGKVGNNVLFVGEKGNGVVQEEGGAEFSKEKENERVREREVL